MLTQPFVVRRSSIHGRGAFATRRIRAGARIVEYLGERIDGDEAARRSRHDDGHTVLFEVHDDLVIDGSRHGNDARFINHSCAPNCETDIRGERVFIFALRAIEPGEELTFDYALMIDGPYRGVWATRYACGCGAPRCRGSMLRLRAENRTGRMYQRLLAARTAARGGRARAAASATPARARPARAQALTARAAGAQP